MLQVWFCNFAQQFMLNDTLPNVPMHLTILLFLSRCGLCYLWN